ncbi:hypothetical protein IJH02_03240 [Candidatus Saccharibacteria bacterium]|nr:hypothetical protein [Candidatus Saccharibacteria bacterium]
MAEEKAGEKSIFKRVWFWITLGSVLGVGLIGLTAFLVITQPWKRPDTSQVPKIETIIAQGKIGTEEAIVKKGVLYIIAAEPYIRPYTEYSYWSSPSHDEEYLALNVLIGSGGILETHEESYDVSHFYLVDKDDNLISGSVYMGDDEKYLDKGVIMGPKAVSGLVVFKIDKTQKINDLRLKYWDAEAGFQAYFYF